MKNNLILFILTISTLSCQPSREKGESAGSLKNAEAREDSVKMATAMLERNKISHTISPKYETEPVIAGVEEDAADDPAIWYNQNNPGESIVFGTDKKGGIYAYDLHGYELDYYPVGKINNIDIRQNIPLAGSRIDVIGGSNRTDNSLVLYQIDSAGKLEGLLSESLYLDTLEINEVYGFCLYKNQEDSLFAIINGKNGRIHSYILKRSADSVWLEQRNHWETGTQPEGMVADDHYGLLYVGEEERGIWSIDLKHKNSQENIRLIHDSGKENNPYIEYDIEGLAIYDAGDGDGFLLASVQGSFSYAMFNRKGENQYIGSFVIGGDQLVDDAEETDGLEVFSSPMGRDFPAGILVVQDGFNYDNGDLKSQNFKYVDLMEVIKLWKELKDLNL